MVFSNLMVVVLIELSWIVLPRREYLRLAAETGYAVVPICRAQITGQAAGNPTAFTLAASPRAVYGRRAQNLLLVWLKPE